MSVTIYHNPRCRKSREGLEYLRSKGIEPEIRTYISDPMSVDEFGLLMSKLNSKAADMIRTQEEIYRKELKGKDFTDEEWMLIILEEPKLLKRPIVVKGNRAIWADPAQNIDQLI